MSNVLILVAVRLKSSRLPKKALQKINGVPLIIRLTKRIQLAKIPKKIIWCTSTSKQDDPLEQLAIDNDILIYRGSELDVMSRFLDVAEKYNSDTIVRVTGDNPLTDPIMLDCMLEKHLENNSEYTYTNDLPIGTRCEVINVEMMKSLHSRLQDPNSSEYMTYMLNRPDQFSTLSVPAYSEQLKSPLLRLTVDTPEDLMLMKKIYEKFDNDNTPLGDIVEWLESNPKVKEMNEVVESQELDPAINCKLVGDV